MVETERRSGWVTFGGVLVLIAGGFNLIWGLGALEKKELFDASRLVYTNLEFWAWWFIAIGALQLLTAVLLFVRSAWGAILAVIGATVSALVAFFALLANTDWALAVLALDVIVLWAVLSHIEEFE